MYTHAEILASIPGICSYSYSGSCPVINNDTRFTFRDTSIKTIYVVSWKGLENTIDLVSSTFVLFFTPNYNIAIHVYIPESPGHYYTHESMEQIILALEDVTGVCLHE